MNLARLLCIISRVFDAEQQLDKKYFFVLYLTQAYRLVGDYYLPLITLKEEDDRSIGKYGMLRKIFLKEHYSARYNVMLLSGKLQKHLADIDEQAYARMDILTEQMRAAEGVTEELKSQDWLSWLRKANSIQNRVEEIVLKEIVYSYGK